MKYFTRTLLVAAALVAAATMRPAAQSASIQADLLKDWTAMKDQMAKLADAMPEDKYGFKSTPAQRSFGEHVMHIAGANVMIIKTLGAKTPAPSLNMKATSKADVMKAMADSFDFGIAAIREQTDMTMGETVQGPSFLGPSTRARMVWATLGHTWDTYGQMVVYLRLNGIVPPASRQM
jgi:hypothetical protein